MSHASARAIEVIRESPIYVPRFFESVNEVDLFCEGWIAAREFILDFLESNEDLEELG